MFNRPLKDQLLPKLSMENFEYLTNYLLKKLPIKILKIKVKIQSFTERF